MAIKRIDIRVSSNIKKVVLKDSIQCVNRLYLDNLINNDKSLKFNYINIYLTTIADEIGRTEIVSNFLDFYVFFDFQHFNSFNTNKEKRIYVLNTLHNSMLELCKIFNWNITQFNDSYITCLEKQVIYEGFFKNKLFLSPDKNFYMGLYFVVDIGSYDIYEVLYDKKKVELVRRKCYHDTGMVFIVEWASWENNNLNFYYRFKGPAKTFVCNINNLLEGKQYDLNIKSSDFFK